MPTLSELLNDFGVDAETEKTASEQSMQDGMDVSEEELLELLNDDEQEKTASDGATLQDIYLQIVEQDEDIMKQAAAEGAEGFGIAEEEHSLKVAAEYEAGGRIAGRAFVDEVQKLAEQDMVSRSKAKTPALGPRSTDFEMETNYEGGGRIDTKGGEKQNANILKGQAEGPAGKAEKAMGPQFATVKSIMSKRAPKRA